MTRPAFRFALLCLLSFLLPLPASAQPAESQAVVLQYHHVSTTTPRSTSVTPDEFREEMQYLHDNGFAVLPLPKIIQALKSGEALPDRTVAITFDDAFVSIYTTAYPLLKQFGWPFTVFVTSSHVGTNPKLYLSWDQLREMGKTGATLANHSVTHSYMLTLKPGETQAAWLARMEQEITDAEQKILQETGQSHHLHAYPFGEYNSDLQRLLVKLGYVGFGQQSGAFNAAADFTALPRYPFSGSYATLKSFIQKANTLAFKVKIVSPQDPITADAAPVTLLDFDGPYRLDRLVCNFNGQAMTITPQDQANQVYKVSVASAPKVRRIRYVCTAPGRDGRFYWFTVPFFNPAIPDG